MLRRHKTIKVKLYKKPQHIISSNYHCVTPVCTVEGGWLNSDIHVGDGASAALSNPVRRRRHITR